MEEKNGRKFKKAEIALITFLVFVIIAAGIAIFLVLREYGTGEKTYDAFQDYVFLPAATPVVRPDAPKIVGVRETPAPPAAEGENEKEAVVDMRAPVVDFASLQAVNPDILGWIYNPGTAINYPIVQGDTNEEYLYHMADGSANKCGSIFLDSESDKNFQDANSVIHGHNMSNGSMFGELKKYANQEYYDEHTKIWLVTPEKTYSIEPFAAFVTEMDSDVWKLTFSSEEEFTAWKSEMAKKSYFKSSVYPAAGEKVVTLSTCSYEYENAHFVVLGVLR